MRYINSRFTYLLTYFCVIVKDLCKINTGIQYFQEAAMALSEIRMRVTKNQIC